MTAERSAPAGESPAGTNERVSDVMLRKPKTLSSRATVGDIRDFFRNPHVMTALLVDEGRFCGAIERDGLSADAADGASALDHAELDTPTISLDASVEEALEALRGLESRRLVVLDTD